MTFKTGQKVVCVNDRYNSYALRPVVKGALYTIHGFYTCICGSRQVTLSEVNTVTNMGCRCGRTCERRHSYYTWRFRPLEYTELFGSVDSEVPEIQAEPV